MAAGAKKLVITLTQLDKSGNSKIVPSCTLPLTAKQVVHTIITDRAVFQIMNRELHLIEIMPGSSLEEVAAKTEVRFLEKLG